MASTPRLTRSMSAPPALATTNVFPPTDQQWQEAYAYCSVDPLFEDKPDHNEAVRGYVKTIAMLEDDEKAEIYKEVASLAEKGKSLRPIKTKVDGFKNLVSEKLPLIATGKCVSGIAKTKPFEDGINALKTLLQTMQFSLTREVTGNYSGHVKISVRIAEAKDTNPEDAVMFALAHEFGHGVNLTLDPYNKSDKRYPELYNALLPPLPDTTTANHKLEYFADSFAAVFLAAAVGMDRSKIPGATAFLFAEEKEGKDHPDGALRIAKIRETLEQRT